MDQDNGAICDESAPVADLIGKLFELQARRAQAYTILNDGFRDFLKSKLEEPFAAIMADVTSTFKECSEQVQKIEKVRCDLMHKAVHSLRKCYDF